MDFEITYLPEQSVVLFKSMKHFDLLASVPAMLDDVHRILNTLDDPVFYLIDIRASHIAVADAMRSMQPLIFGERAFFRHPKIRGILLITPSPLLRRITEGVSSVLKDSLTLLVFNDQDSAFAYVKRRVKSTTLSSKSHP